MNIVFAAIAPHPPLLLSSVSIKEDREKVKKTIESLEKLGKELEKQNPDQIVISSPHPEWGINVPLSFLAKDFKGELMAYLTSTKSPDFYFQQGKKAYSELKKDKSYALIASGDLSHCLQEEGPYGFNPDGPKFDKALIEFLKKKDIDSILKLNETYPEAGECGLRSFSFLLGMLEAGKVKWEPEILSYEGPYGVGYLVVNFKILK